MVKNLIGAFYPNSRNPPFALLQGKPYAFTLVQLAKPGMLNRAYMHENIVSTGIGSDKAIALPGVEPFDDSRKRGFLPCAVLLHRFHIDTFLTGGLPRAWVIICRSFHRRGQLTRNDQITSIGNMCCIAAENQKAVLVAV
jgi:hypothetical protein